MIIDAALLSMKSLLTPYSNTSEVFTMQDKERFYQQQNIKFEIKRQMDFFSKQFSLVFIDINVFLIHFFLVFNNNSHIQQF